MENENPSTIDIAVRYTTELTLIEIGLGSFLHSFRIPFSGHLLALNQCFILNRAAIANRSSTSPFLAMTISNTAAILKTLSPRGKRFTPMLAISVQGLLFNLGILVFGTHVLGRCIASMLLSLWPMVQPLVIYGIILGDQFGSLIAFYNKAFSKISWLGQFNLQMLLISLLVLNLLLALLVSLFAAYLPLSWIDKYREKFTAYVNPTNPKKSHRAFPKDLYSFPFLVTMSLCAIFFYATLDSFQDIFYAMCRLLATAYITFVILRNIPIDWLLKFLQKLPLVNKCAPYIQEVWKSIQKNN